MVKYENTFFKETKRAFFQEATLAFAIDFLICFFSWLLFTSIDINNVTKKLFLVITVSYFLLAIILHYRTFLLELFDLARGNVIEESVYIIDYKTENVWSGRLGNSNVHLFFPKDKMVDRFKLYFIGENGEKFVRTILSIQKRQMLNRLFLDNPTNPQVKIKYLKSSKVLLSFEPSLNSKNDIAFEKEIYRLNKFM